MKISCFTCHKEMLTPGAIVFGPPFKNCRDLSMCTVHKYHICCKCWDVLIDNLEQVNTKAKDKK